ncbi:Soluble lamin-associated protein of 75 kDa [Bagarius yarrelli]|uniref:Soluble lamin-associated protein of 75 kDa n=1 Tax=Bagarius yarrelli TaxID=175774 RepID=A0A556TUC2_BAGYA|nr:Soluble lamin-associated protein of 75 kDa [Bagarius yarrelli]
MNFFFSAGMAFPVDVLDATSHGELERSAHSYMNELLYIDPDHAHNFTLASGKKVQISLSSVGFVPLYGANLQHKVLALFTPQDQLTAVALFLANRWYSMEDILKTANARREGLIKVRSLGERIVLYVLNRIVYRTNEMGSGEMPFLCHSENEYAKILWKSGQAVGFYSVKPKGSVCNNSLKQCYFLPVMDSIFVRKSHRGNSYGLQMLEDFVNSFDEDELGLKYPLSPAMINVCRHYLDRYPGDVDLFWEEEADEDVTSAIGVEEVEEMPVDEEHQAFVQKDASQIVDSATEKQEAAPSAEDNQEIECNSVDYLQQNKENAPAAEKENAAENDQKQIDAPEAKKRKVTPVAEEEQEAHTKVVASVSEEKQEDASLVKKDDAVAGEVQEEAPAAEDKPTETVRELEGSTLVEEVQELALEVVDEVDPAAEKEEDDTGSETSDYKVDFDVEKEEVEPPTSVLSFSLVTDPEGEQKQVEALDVGNDLGVTGISVHSSQEKDDNENTTLTVEEEEDEMDEEDINVNEPSDISQAFTEARTKAVPPTSKRTSRRLSKMTTEDGEEEQTKEVEKDKEMTTEGKRVMKEEEEEEADHCSEEEEQEQDPPVIDKRVLRGKPKVHHMRALQALRPTGL